MNGTRKKDPMSDDISEHDLLIRIDERTQSLQDEFEKLKITLDTNYVTQAEFWPVKAIVFSGAGLILTAVLTGLVALVIKG